MKKKPIAISSVLQSTAKKLGLEKGMDLYRLKNRWGDVVGHPIASHTSPISFYHDTLTLHVDGAAWMHELSFLKGEIVKKINRGLGKPSVRNLRLKLAPISTASPQGKGDSRPSRKTLSGADSKRLGERLSGIRDDSLKRAIQQAMSRHRQDA
ncbi:MAG: DUF721 domain-containing protein [Nitrospiria bacterium]